MADGVDRRAVPESDRGRRGKLTRCLRWQLTWGEHYDWLREVAEDSGESNEACDTKEDLRPDAIPFWNAWVRLHRYRQRVPVGLGGITSQPLTFEAISRFLDARGLTPGEPRDVFERMFDGLEEAFMEHVDAELSKS